jgi:membrane protease YdiL (CAAX protease family)
MNPEPPQETAPAETPPPELAAQPPRRESYPFWGYLDLLAFLLVALFALVVESLVGDQIVQATHVKSIFVLLPAQFVLYGFLLGTLAVIFRRYYGRPFWESIRWVRVHPSGLFVVICGVGMAFTVIFASILLRTPDINSPMKELLSDKASIVLVAVFGTTLAPICEEILFRGFLQPLLVRSVGPAGGILLAAVPFGLLHLQEYGYSWRHGLLITMAGAAFGWMRHQTGSTRAAAIMHATYNGVFFVLLAAQGVAADGR